MLPPGGMSTITGSLQVYALVSLSIACVLMPQISANIYNVSRNKSIDNNVSESNLESVKEEAVLKHKNQIQAHNETNSKIKNYNISQNNIQGYETNAQNKYSMNNSTQIINNKNNESPYIIINSNKTETMKQNKTKSNNTFERLEEPVSSETGQYLKQETEKELLSYSRAQHSRSENLLVQKYFKQYKLAGNINGTISQPVVPSSLNNSTKLVEIVTKEEYRNKPQNHSSQQSMTSSKEESRQLSPGQFGYYFIGPKLWYVPLFFSIYFLFYVAALIIKSISRHKIVFVHEKPKVVKPYLPYGRNLVRTVLTESVLNALESAAKKYL